MTQSGLWLTGTLRIMAQEQNHLLWIDMEMTGLEPEQDRILEIAMVVTNNDLDIVAEGPVLAVSQPDEVLEGMDEWNRKTHGQSGLIERVKSSTLAEADVEEVMLNFIREWAPRRSSPMCGNSVCQDRRFMARYMPSLEDWFHYRNLDVSTLKELARRWKPEVYQSLVKKGRHEALADILESIDELRHYRQHFLRID